MRGLATSLVTRYVFKEDDNNNKNFSKWGQFIDFEMTKFNISSHFKELDLFSRAFRQPNQATYICTEQDIRRFPDIKDAMPFYWPTTAPMISLMLIKIMNSFIGQFEHFFIDADDQIYKELSRIVLEVASALYVGDETQSLRDRLSQYAFKLVLKLKSVLIGQPEVISIEQKKLVFEVIKNNFMHYLTCYLNSQDIPTGYLQQFGAFDNCFSPEDNESYKLLSTHPVFIFHKFKTFLKYILMDENAYQSIAKLYIRPSSSYIEKGNKINLRESLVQDEIARIKEIRAVLSGMPEFKEFLICHGDFALKMIKKEIACVEHNYAAKSHAKPYYQTLVNSLSSNGLDIRYAELLNSLGFHSMSRAFNQ